jgi:hypothetical protein
VVEIDGLRAERDPAEQGRDGEHPGRCPPRPDRRAAGQIIAAETAAEALSDGRRASWRGSGGRGGGVGVSGMTRIVSYVHRYERPPKKRKATAVDVPAIIATKRSRRRVRWSREIRTGG